MNIGSSLTLVKGDNEYSLSIILTMKHDADYYVNVTGKVVRFCFEKQRKKRQKELM